jgi:translation initiation factor IF-2
MGREAICIALESKHSGNKTCSVVVREGTLKIGDVLVGKNTYCKVKNILDDNQNSMEESKAGFAVDVVTIFWSYSEYLGWV